MGVRSSALVPGRWVLAGMVVMLALAAIVFVLLPHWLAPAPGPAPPAPANTPPPKAAAAHAATEADTSRTVRERLLAEEAAARYREESESLRAKGAATWASDGFAGAGKLAEEAAAALSAGDHVRARDGYQEASHRLAQIAAQAEAVFERAAADGEAALQAGSSENAAQAFRLALMIHPEDPRAGRGLARAEKLDDALALYAAGQTRESASRLAEAREAYAAALALDPAYGPAGAALKRLDDRVASQRFDAMMTQGLSQLERSDWTSAEQSFGAALKMRPGDPPAADGLARARLGLQREQLSRLQREGQALESEERWDDALAVYRRAAEVDPAVDFARAGISRSERMTALHARIVGYLDDPQRLYSPRVREEARRLLASLEEDTAGRPRLDRERQRLEAALKRASVKITLQLTSDNATEVMLYRVGSLGRFLAREVTVSPGSYTLVGSRPGYKDTRVEVTVEPDGPAPRVFIACEERV
jgi:tetratricopeptide (TPR) repeat protein